MFTLALLAFGALATFNKIRFQYDWNNALWRTIMTPMTGTIWAEGFDEDAFAQVKVGMLRSEVESLGVGKPLDERCHENGCFLRYTNQDTGTADFDRRWLGFDRNGRVDYIRNDFWID
jgi:hypothetical protein